MSEGASNNILSLDPSRIFMTGKGSTIKDWAMILPYTRSGKDFNPGIGFQQKEGLFFLCRKPSVWMATRIEVPSYQS